MLTAVPFNSAGTSLFDFCPQGALSQCFMSWFMLFSNIFWQMRMLEHVNIKSGYAPINLCEIHFSYEYQ